MQHHEHRTKLPPGRTMSLGRSYVQLGTLTAEPVDGGPAIAEGLDFTVDYRAGTAMAPEQATRTRTAVFRFDWDEDATRGAQGLARIAAEREQAAEGLAEARAAYEVIQAAGSPTPAALAATQMHAFSVAWLKTLPLLKRTLGV